MSIPFLRNRPYNAILAVLLMIGVAGACVPPASAATATDGDYVKGERFSDVYLVEENEDGDLFRRAFVNEQMFFTWQNNFDAVRTVSDAALAALPLGPLVLPKSGVVLVKIQIVEKVYAVDDGALRWITTEDVADELYGRDWADYVIDLPPTVFAHFEQGDAIDATDDAPDRSSMKTRAELVATDDAPPVQDDGADNPFASAALYVDPTTSARQQVDAWSATRPDDAASMERIASQPMARWFGDWNDDIRSSVDRYVSTVTDAGALPVLVAYNVPNRDCGSYSAGGSDSDAAYLDWIADFAEGIGARSAVVILEPDATATSCVTDGRLALLGDAVRLLKANAGTAVYVDAGHDNWIPADTMAARLEIAGIADANGFALNVSNFYTTEENTGYGEDVSDLLGGARFVIDTSRNGSGWNGEWCNPSDRSIGVNPTTDTGNARIDALLWIKPPGESDGTCNGGPSAGAWWAEYALGLTQ